MSLGHVYIILELVGSTRLKFGDDWCYDFMCFDVPKVVQSTGYDHRHDEESLNGRDINIYILEAYVWTSEVFRVKSAFYRSIGRLPEPPGNLMGLNGPSGGSGEEAKGQPRAPPPSKSELDKEGGRRPPFPFFPLLLPPQVLIQLGKGRESYSR